MNNLLKFISKHSGWIIAITLSLVPILLWLRIVDIQYRFASLYSVLASGAQITGLVGMSMFAVTLILSSRLVLFEDFFGGMNRVYIAHHTLGGISFILLMLHPLFSAIARAVVISPLAAATLFLPSDDWAVNFGILSLALMMLILILTLFVKIKYQIWKSVHQFMGLVFFIAGLHVFLIPSDVSIDPILRYYILGLGTIALILYTYKTILGKWLVPKSPYIISAVVKPGDRVIQLDLKPVKKSITFFPGQFIFISINNRNTGKEQHPFSISSSPLDSQLRLSIKSLGDYTNSLGNVQQGDTVYIEGPYGRFFGPGKAVGSQIWIAGGIGITPFLSMARTLRAPGMPIDLYYIVKTKNEAVYFEELIGISETNAQFKLHLVETTLSGHLTAEALQKELGEIKNREVFICGPPLMMKSFRRQFIHLGISYYSIHTEEFALL